MSVVSFIFFPDSTGPLQFLLKERQTMNDVNVVIFQLFLSSLIAFSYLVLQGLKVVIITSPAQRKIHQPAGYTIFFFFFFFCGMHN